MSPRRFRQSLAYIARHHICSVVVLCSLTGCLRYISPIKTTETTKISGDSNVYVSDDRLFYGFINEQVERRARLLAERAPLLQGVGYRLGTDDLLDVKFFDAPELNTKVRVLASGQAAFPLVGQLAVAGLTLQECEEVLQRALRTFLRNPDISLRLDQPRSRTFTVMGEVRSPGVYPMRRDYIGVLEAIAEAGGTTQGAGRTILLIPKSAVPHDTSSTRAPGIELSLVELTGARGTPAIQVPIEAGDTLVVRPAGKIEVDGEVKKPGSMPMPPESTLSGALAAAGGLTYSADVENVQVIRDIGSGRFAVKAFNVEELLTKERSDIVLRAGDVVRVNSSPGAFTTRQVIESLNSFFILNVSGNVNVN